MTVGRAAVADLPEVLHLLNDAAAWLHAKGLDQWPDGFSAERIGPLAARHEVWIAREGGRPAGTVTLSAEADPDFWTDAEGRQSAVYVSKLAITRADAGLGALLLRWAVDYAARIGCEWARLDAWRTNEQLHAYYRRQGWEHVRTVSLPHRRSGALFQRPALPDLEARAAFTLAGALALPARGRIAAHARPGPARAARATMSRRDGGARRSLSVIPPHTPNPIPLSSASANPLPGERGVCLDADIILRAADQLRGHTG